MFVKQLPKKGNCFDKWDQDNGRPHAHMNIRTFESGVAAGIQQAGLCFQDYVQKWCVWQQIDKNVRCQTQGRLCRALILRDIVGLHPQRRKRTLGIRVVGLSWAPNTREWPDDQGWRESERKKNKGRQQRYYCQGVLTSQWRIEDPSAVSKADLL